MFLPTDHVADRVDDFVHDNLDPASAQVVEEHCAQCADCQAALAAARKRLTALQALPPREASEGLVQTILGQVRGHNARQRRLRRMFGWGTLIGTAAAVLLLVTANVYYARLAASPYNLAVLGQSKLFPATAGSLCVRLVNARTGAALSAVPVEVVLRSRDRSRSVQLASFQTDAQGAGLPKFTLPDWADGDYTLHVIAHPDGQTEEVTQPVALRRSWKLMLSSDKPVYQPGQTIHLRALALRRPDLKPVAEQDAVFSITDPKGNIVFKRQAKTSAFGITAADCLLATEVNEGAYTVACKVGDTDSRLTVDVKKYVLPKFKIELAGLEPYYKPGQEVKGTIRAAYFFGGPVANAAVEVAIGDAGLPGGGQPLTVRTNDAGNAELAFTVPKQLAGREQDGGDARMRIDVKVRDTAGQEERRSFSRIVTVQPLRVEVIPENGRLVLGMANRVWLFVSSPDGKPLADAAVSLTRVGTRREGEPAKLDAKTNELGVAALEVVPVANQETWEVTADAGMNRALARQVMLLCNQSNQDFILRTDKAVYNGGETMQLTALGGGPGAVYVDIIKDGQTYLTEAIDVKDGRGVSEVDLPADLFGTIELYAYRFDATGLPVRKARTLYIRQARQLNVQAKADRDEYRPGQRAKLQFTLTDDAGKPVPGALSLAAVDEAVFSVLEQAPGMERTFYLLEQELLKPIYAIYPWAPDGLERVAPADRQQFEQALFARTATSSASRPARAVMEQEAVEIDVLDDAPVIRDPRPAGSPHSLSVFSLPVKQRETAERRETGLERVYVGWALLVVALAGVGYVALWTFVRWQWVLVAHAAALPASCLLLIIPLTLLSGGGAAMRFDVLTAGLAEGALPTAAPPAAGDDEGPESGGGVRVRRDFPETLLWRPELITDDQGHASLDVPLADSITTWRLTASAVSADGRLGALQSSIRVFQPFFVDVNLPVALTRTDEVAVPVVVYNYLDEAQTVELALDDADWFERRGDPVQRIELKPRAVQSVHYRLRIKQAGSHKLLVKAQGHMVADAIERTVEVVPNGRKIEQVVTDRFTGDVTHAIDIPEQAVPGSAQLVVKLYPGILSQLVDGLDGMLRMPYGCFEQTSSTTYPNVLIADYLKKSRTGSPAMLAKAEQFIHLGYQRLLTFEVRGGGFDWYGRGPANLWLTAYGLQEFHDMAQVHAVDADLITRTQRWLLNQQANDGSWGDANSSRWSPEMGDAKLLLTSYVAWSLLETGCRDPKLDRAINYILGHLNDAKENAYLLALTGNALASWDAKDPRTVATLQRLDKLRKEIPEWQACSFPHTGQSLSFATREGAAVETTALAVLALRKVEGFEPTVNQALTYLVKSKDANGSWGSTQATVLTLKALVAALAGAKQEENATVVVLVNGREVKKAEVTPLNADVLQVFDLREHTRPGKNEVTLRATGKTNLMYQVVGRHYDATPAPAMEKPALAVDVVYDRTELTTTDAIKAAATVRNQSAETAHMVIVDLGIPPGFEANPSDFTTLVRPKDAAAIVEKATVTARQVILYLKALPPGGQLTIDYSLRPRFPVKVQAPAVTVYEYYTPTNRAVARPVVLTVE